MFSFTNVACATVSLFSQLKSIKLKNIIKTNNTNND